MFGRGAASPLAHPFDMELEVCTALPASVLQMLSLKVAIITFKRCASRLSLKLVLLALRKLAFIYDSRGPWCS